MRRCLSAIAVLMLSAASFCASARELPQGDDTTRQTRLFPSQRDRNAKEIRELRQTIDSLNAIIETLRTELVARDSIATGEVELVELSSPADIIREPAEPAYKSEYTDSLLGDWYSRGRLIAGNNSAFANFDDLENIGEFNSDSVRFTGNVPDSVLIERLESMNSFITLPFNQTVKNYMVLYSEKNTAKISRILGLADYYFPIFEDVFSRYDIPLELKYLSIIESALNPAARSRAGARGIWQFMLKTGKQYGLTINSYVDERMDAEKATDAAARYLSDLYRLFGDWTLAISSYNCGPGNVNKAIRKAGGRRDFWSIYPHLPRETRGYMPAFVGAMYAMRYYKEYGITPGPMPMPAHADTFVIRRNLHFGQISSLIGVSMDELREMNTQYIHDIIPGKEAPYTLKLPYQYTNSFIDCQDSLYTHLSDSLMSPAVIKGIEEGTSIPGGGNVINYRVKSGDYLGRIAGRYHVSVKQLMSWNHLRSTNLRIGQVLTIYTGGSAPKEDKGSFSPPKSQYSADTYKGDYIIYTVKSGDSLYSIARQYSGISANDIMAFNNCTSSLQPGQKLKIPQP